MRRKDREQSREFAIGIVDKCAFGTLAMITPDGLPYCVPLSIARVGENIYFHSAKAGLKTDCMRNAHDVCLSCVGDVTPQKDKFTTAYESAIVRGKVSEVTDDKEKIEALRAICLRYTPENMGHFDEAIAKSLGATAIWKIGIDEITGKAKIIGAKHK